MSTCNFSIERKQDINELIKKAENAITSAKGTFEGDTEKGSFALSTPLGKISGSYVVEANDIAFTISDKPMFLPCSTIENELKKYLGVA